MGAEKSPIADDRGWWFPAAYGKVKAHWANDEGRSLCGRWLALGVPDEAFDTDADMVTNDECAACRRKLDKRRGVAP